MEIVKSFFTGLLLLAGSFAIFGVILFISEQLLIFVLAGIAVCAVLGMIFMVGDMWRDMP